MLKDKDSNLIYDENQQVKLSYADLEIRMSTEPFALYPGEILKQSITPLKVVAPNSALRLRAILDFDDENGVKRTAGGKIILLYI